MAITIETQTINYLLLSVLCLQILRTAGPWMHPVQLHLANLQTGLWSNISKSEGISDFENAVKSSYVPAKQPGTP